MLCHHSAFVTQMLQQCLQNQLIVHQAEKDWKVIDYAKVDRVLVHLFVVVVVIVYRSVLCAHWTRAVQIEITLVRPAASCQVTERVTTVRLVAFGGGAD